MRPGLAVAAAVAVLDQASKWWIVDVVMDPPRRIPVTSFFNLVMGWNRGISFGLFAHDSQATTWALVAVAGAVVTALLWWLRSAERRSVVLAVGLIVGGAVGNLIDRVRFGAVADFLDLHVAGWHWPAFNVADSAITVGAMLLVFDTLFAPSERTRTEAGKGTDEP